MFRSIRLVLAFMVLPAFGERRVFNYDAPDMRPIYFGGTSAAENVHAADYCVWLDVIYTDGSGEWGKCARWSGGTHGWERSAGVILPKKPVKRIELFFFMRKGTGRAQFRDVFLERTAPPAGTVLRTVRRTNRPYDDSDEELTETFDGERGVVTSRCLPAKINVANPLAPDSADVWVADSMACVTPLTFPSVSSARAVDLELAGRERESAQVCISTGTARSYDSVTVDISDLRTEKAVKFPGRATWQRVGYLPRWHTYQSHPMAPAAHEKWMPDPLLPAAPFKVRKGATQGVWLTFAADADVAAGVYRGCVKVKADGSVIASVPVTLRVRGFSLPPVFGHRSAFSVMDGLTRYVYKDQAVYEKMRRASWDVMLDHRLNPDDICRTEPPPIKDLFYARSRGMNLFNVRNLVPPDPEKTWVLKAEPEDIFNEPFYVSVTNQLVPYLAEVRRLGLGDCAYVYGFDERKSPYYEGMLRMWPRLKKDLGLPLFTTARMYHDVVNGKISRDSPYAMIGDWHCPLSQLYRPGLSADYRARGRQVWWYTCCGPTYPHANFASYEYPPYDGRLIYWMTHLYRADGLLYWHVNYWERNKAQSESDTYFPGWQAWSHFDSPGDGVLMYPGREHVLPGIRLANVRDGAEDFEWLRMAAERGTAATDSAVRSLVRSMTDFVREPAALRAVRTHVGDIIEENAE